MRRLFLTLCAVLAAGAAFAQTPVYGPGAPPTIPIYLQVHLVGAASAPTSNFRIPYDAVDYDTAGWWNAANKRYQPLRAGKYLVQSHVAFYVTTPTVGSTAQIFFFQNQTTTFASAIMTATSTSSEGTTLSHSTIITMNGSTDYIEEWSFLSGTAGAIGQANNGFQTILTIIYLGP